MPIKYLKWEDGSRLRVLEHDGVCIPTRPYPTHEKEFKSLPAWKARDDDILICAYPKTGLTSHTLELNQADIFL